VSTMGEIAEPATPGPRRFCRFSTGRSVADGYWPLPEDGLCLSVFLLLSPADGSERVLVGRIDPAAAWDQIGALDPGRLRAHSGKWMIPSCHLLQFEAPAEAARRILREQLGRVGPTLAGPEIYSEAYPPRRDPGRGHHWDLEIVYRGRLDSNDAPGYPSWAELKFIDPSRTPRSDFARSHEEILDVAGFRVGTESP
jgi:ADP-ribose pyrophosphatase YjhB (NUDIX family)